MTTNKKNFHNELRSKPTNINLRQHRIPMPSFAESNLNNNLQLIFKIHCRSLELLHVSRHSLPTTRPKVLLVAIKLITEPNQTPYIITRACADIGFSIIRLQRTSITDEPIGNPIEYNIEEFMTIQTQANDEGESNGGDI